MVDIHCHIVPDVDDGAWNMEAALAMARIAVRSGIRRIIATPHFLGVPESLDTLPDMLRQFLRLKDAVRREGLPLELIPGAEILCVPQTLEMAHRGCLPQLGGSRYVLVEFYFDVSGEFLELALEELCSCGYIPVVAHPERYGAVQRNPDLASGWFRRGIVLQVNKGSVLGAFGSRAEETALRLLDRGVVHVIASDAHSPERRTTDLSLVRRWALENLGREYTHILLEDNPARISRGEPLRRVTAREP